MAVIVTSTSYGTHDCETTSVDSNELTVLTYQQFLPGATDISVEISEMDRSKARVYILIIDNNADTQLVLSTANEYKLIDYTYVWICYDGCANDFTTRDAATYEVIDEYVTLAQGIIGVNLVSSAGELYDKVNEEWLTLDPVEFPSVNGANSSISMDAQYAYDSVLFVSSALHQLILADGIDEYGRIKSTDQFYELLIQTIVEGTTGKLEDG